MTIEIKVPTLGESVTEATVGKWFKKAGDAVKVDDVVVTSGIDGSVFPPDIVVGTVTKVPPPDGTSDGAERVSGVEVSLKVDPGSLSFVTVLLWQPAR